MLLKGVGAVLILGSCVGIGCSIAMGFRQEAAMLRTLERVLSWMECELQYRLTPLPELCTQATREAGGSVRSVLFRFARELEAQNFPEPSDCMSAALRKEQTLPKSIRRCLTLLGSSLGHFDLSGQLQGLREVRAICTEERYRLLRDSAQRLRSYQTLSLCAGAALVILFL